MILIRDSPSYCEFTYKFVHILLKIVLEIYHDEFSLHMLQVPFFKKWGQHCALNLNFGFLLGCYLTIASCILLKMLVEIYQVEFLMHMLANGIFQDSDYETIVLLVQLLVKYVTILVWLLD